MKAAVLALLVGLGALVRSCFSGEDQPLAAFPHPVWDSGLYPDDVGRFFWVDDDTILFSASAGPKPRNDTEARARYSILYLWRLGDMPRPYGADPKLAARTYCAADGWISFQQRTIDPVSGTGVSQTVEGPVGKESAHAIRPPFEDMRLRFRSMPKNDSRWIPAGGNCQPTPDIRMAGRRWVTDTDRRYRLDFDGPVIVLTDADNGNPVELPIAAKDTAPECTHFHRFDSVFLVWDCWSLSTAPDRLERWHQNRDCWPIWRVEPPEGRIEKTCLPFGDWAEHGVNLVPTKTGLDFTAYDSRRPDPGPMGLYELRNNTVHRILAGFITSPVVSPSGCKVIFAYASNIYVAMIGTSGSPTIVATDLCAPRRP